MNTRIAFFLSLIAAAAGGIAFFIVKSNEQIEKLKTSEAKVSSSLVWERNISYSGRSSLRATYVNEDEIKDIISIAPTKKASNIIALNGEDGRILWQQRLSYKAFGTPIIIEQADMHESLIILRGQKNIYGLQAKSGKQEWSFSPKNIDKHVQIQSVIPCGDTNQDKVIDLILAVQVEKDKVKLYKVDGKTGALINESATTFLNRKNITASCLLDQKKDLQYVFNHRVKNKTFRTAVNSRTFDQIWSQEQPGSLDYFSPSFINQYGDFLGLSNSTDGKIDFFYSKTGKEIWQRIHKNSKFFSPLAFGNFNQDPYIDIVGHTTTYENKKAKTGKLLWIDGKTGGVFSQQDLPLVTYTSPLIADFNRDGFNEVIIMTNTTPQKTKQTPAIISIFDGKRQKLIHEIKLKGYSKATPLLMDLDDDKRLDLIVSSLGKIARYKLLSRSYAKSTWPQQNGERQNGHYPKRRYHLH